MDFKTKIRDVVDFPQKGIAFKDIAPLLEDADSFRLAIGELVAPFKGKKVDKVVGIDARGFIFAGAIASELGAGMVMVRKKGKLPFETENQKYKLEYGESTLEIHTDSIKKGENVLLVDDVLATGGTMVAAVKLVEKVGGNIFGVSFLIILDYLSGKEKLKNHSLFSLVNYQ